MKRVKLSATNGGYYHVLRGGEELSQHEQEREAIQEAVTAALEDPEAEVTYRHDYEVRVSVERGEEPEPVEPEEPEPVEPEEPEPEAPWDSGVWTLELDGQRGEVDFDHSTVTLPMFGRQPITRIEMHDDGRGALIQFELVEYGRGLMDLRAEGRELRGVATAGGHTVPVTGKRAAAQEPAEPSEPNPDAPPWRANEPRGFAVLTDRSFDAVTEGGWTHTPSRRTDGTQARFEIVQAANAPVSPPSVGRITFPRGHTGGGSSSYNVHVGYRVPTPKRLYIALALRVSENWYGHTGSSVNKVLYIGQSTMLLLRGGRMDPLYVRFGTQGAENRNLDWNSSNNRAKPRAEQAEVKRGQWRNIEILMEMGQRGQPTGKLRIWVDGVLTHDFEGIRMLRDSNDQYGEVGSIRWHPIYGGQGGVDVPADQWQEIDHMYVSAEV